VPSAHRQAAKRIVAAGALIGVQFRKIDTEQYHLSFF
jgi:hypothetical protein